MLENDCGADFLPMRLAAVMVIVLILLTSVTAYATMIEGQSSKAAARACVARIAAVAAVEYAEGCPDTGAGARLDLSVPACVRTIVFGAAAPNTPGDSPIGTCLIRYVDGSCETHFSGLQLGSGGPGGRGGPIVLYPGPYAVWIRTETVGDRPMALMYVEEA